MRSTGAIAQARAQRTPPDTANEPALSDQANRNVPGPGQEADQARIEQLAYQIYEERGRTDGFALDDWLEAEALVRQGGRDAA